MAPTDIAGADALEPIVKRLEDAHRLWHQAEEAYFDPEGFRLAAQGMIQALRTVTFILQKNKAKIPDFDAWYSPWQQKLAGDPLMRWMVEARNKIEKQGDLDSQNYIRAEIVASYLDDGPSVEVPAKLFQSPTELLSSIPPDVLVAHVVKHGSLRIERKWIENSLPEYELLDAMAIAYGRIAEVIASAHQQTGLSVPEFRHGAVGPHFDLSAMGWRMPCMIGHGTSRSIIISLADAKSMSMTRRTIPISEEGGAKAVKRYGSALLNDLSESKTETLEDVARAFFKTARAIFLKDKGSSGNRVGDLGTSERWKHACQDLEPEIFLISQPVCAALDDADLVVEALDEAERDFVFRLAVGGDAIPMPIDHLGELFKRFEPLPLKA